MSKHEEYARLLRERLHRGPVTTSPLHGTSTNHAESVVRHVAESYIESHWMTRNMANRFRFQCGLWTVSYPPRLRCWTALRRWYYHNHFRSMTR